MHSESFQIIPMIILTLKEPNPNTVFEWNHKMVYNNKSIFDRVFWAFKPLIDGFQHHYTLISIDDTCIYKKCKAKLLIAIPLDMNNEVYLLCYVMIKEKMNNN